MFHSPNSTNLLSRILLFFFNFHSSFVSTQCFHRTKLVKMFRSPNPDYLNKFLWRFFSLPFSNLHKCFVWTSTLYLHRKKNCGNVTRWIIYDRFPGSFQLYFSVCNRSIFFHTRFSQKILWKCFGHVTSLTGNWRRQSALTGVLQSVSVLRPEQSAMRLLRSHWKAQQILSNANWVIKRFLCQQRCQIESWILELKKIK